MGQLDSYYEWATMSNLILICLIGTSPLALTVNIMKDIENSSVVVQWDAVNDSLTTTYTVTWTSENDLSDIRAAALKEQTSYTITGLTLDTVYTITVTALNRCGAGPEFTTRITFSADTISTISSISPAVTASTNPMTIMSTVNPNAATTTIATTSTTQLSTTTATVKMNPSTTTTISMTTTVSRDTDTTSSTTKITSLMTVISSTNPCTTDPITTIVTSISMLPRTTANPADTTTANGTCKFSSTYS